MKKAYRHFKKNLISQGLVDPGIIFLIQTSEKKQEIDLQ
jgi:hypothetical protein